MDSIGFLFDKTTLACIVATRSSYPKKPQKEKEGSVGEPLAKFRLFLTVSGIDTTWTKEIKKKITQWGNPLQNSGFYFQKG